MTHHVSSLRLKLPCSIGKVTYQRTQPFVAFLPLAWAARAATAPGTRYGMQLGVLLHYRVGLTRSPTVTISRKLLARFKIDNRSYLRALAALEARGLVVVQRQEGKKARITLIPYCEPAAPEAHVAL